MTMPDVSGLPVDNDAIYADDPTDPARKLHQQHHDLVHAAVKALLPRADALPLFDLTARVAALEAGSVQEFSALLLEVGGYLLLESGDLLLMEV